MKIHTPQFDWSAFRHYIEPFAEMPSGSEIPVSEDYRRFVRFQRFIRKWAQVSDPDAACRAMINLAEDQHLDWHRAARLYIRLQGLASWYSYRSSMERLERAGDAVKDLEKIQKSLQMLEFFSEKLLSENARPRHKIAETKLENAAWFWADALRRESEIQGRVDKGWEEAKALGFRHTMVPFATHGFAYDPGVSCRHTYNSEGVVRTWLRSNVLFSKLVTNIIKKERTPRVPNEIDETAVDGVASAPRLAAEKLPRLYKQCTGKDFSFSTNKEGDQLRDAGGPRFARMCFPVMGMDMPSLNTLKAHWQNLRRRASGS